MDMTQLLATINLLAEQLDHKPDDLHEVHFKVQEIIRELKATGMSVPEDLVRFEQELVERVEGGK
jgi:hypothetical protein